MKNPDTVFPQQIDALLPDGSGHHFLFYGDACSGVAGAPNERSFARTNEVVRRISPQPQFVVFTGDEIVGLTTSETELRDQWRYWFDVEMAWLDRTAIPLFNTTSNHTTYDVMSEQIFADELAHLPRNGPPGQQGLSYFVRRDDLLLVFVHTGPTNLGGEGHVETEWLAETLEQHRDARFKFVVGHHPAFPVNGFAGEYQRDINKADAAKFWSVLEQHRVVAYLCSHILAFDVQVHRDVLQVVSAGAGTPHRMPEGIEYLHAVEMAVDHRGLHYRVIDQAGQIREQLSWPPKLSASTDWEAVPTASTLVSIGPAPEADDNTLLVWRVRGTNAADAVAHRQTFLATVAKGSALPSVWIGLVGGDQRLAVVLGPEPGRSPHYWFGPPIAVGRPFDFQIALHFAMGPGGVLWREHDGAPWSSFTSSSPWGPERLRWPRDWSIGVIPGPPPSARFCGSNLTVSYVRPS